MEATNPDGGDRDGSVNGGEDKDGEGRQLTHRRHRREPRGRELIPTESFLRSCVTVQFRRSSCFHSAMGT